MSNEVQALIDRAKAHIAAKPLTGYADIQARAAFFRASLWQAQNGSPSALDRIKPGINAMTLAAAIAGLEALIQEEVQ